MTVSAGAQAAEFLYALLFGIGTGVVYVLTHFINRIHFLTDLLFSLIVLAAASVFFMTVCGGLVRMYHLLGIFSGMLSFIYFANRILNRRKNGQKQKESKKT